MRLQRRHNREINGQPPVRLVWQCQDERHATGWVVLNLNAAPLRFRDSFADAKT